MWLSTRKKCSRRRSYARYQFALRLAQNMAGLCWDGCVGGTIAGRVLRRLRSLVTGLVGRLGPGKWYLVTFGILGAGELYGVYYPNYLVCCSPASQVRRNLAYAQLLALPVSVAPLIYGMISDSYGLRISVETAAVLLLGTILLIQLALPRRPGIAPSDGISPETVIAEN